MSTTIKIKLRPRAETYNIDIGSGSISGSAPWPDAVTNGKCAVISNRKVFGLYGRQLIEHLSSLGVETTVILIGDGERFKTLRTAEKIIGFLSQSGIGRTDRIIALGGGVVGDVAGFASSIYMRGIPLVQIPTTLLAMLDSSVGGKTGVNTSFGKNMAGTFFQPSSVLIDINVLATLPRREVAAGLCEALKHGVLSGPKLFDRTVEMILNWNTTRGFNDEQAMISFVADQVRFKASVVTADVNESADNRSASSRKILNFGHTLAHALEKATNFRVFKHGEAVGYGILFAAELSKRLDMLDNNVVESLNDVVHRAALLPPLGSIRSDDILDAFRYDKKIIEQDLQWILLSGIGKPLIVPQSAIPSKLLKSVLNDFIRSHSNS